MSQSANFKLNRRNFLKLSGATGALVLGLRLPTAADAAPAEPLIMNMAQAAADFAPSIYINLASDGIITMTVHRSEMGQGVNTAVPMIIAEELDADWSMIRTVQAPADRAYGDQVTGGSVSISGSYTILRTAGASIRQLLVNAAAQMWDVDPATCTTAYSVVTNANGDTLGYGDLIDVSATLPIPGRGEFSLKDPADFTIIGTTMPHRDNPAIVTGQKTYASDVQIDGLLIAVVERCPIQRGSIASVDTSAAEAMPGVKHVVQADDRIAIVADTTWQALKARDALIIEWNAGSNADLNTAAMREAVHSRVSLQNDSETIEAVYENPYLAHMTMEPMTCVANVTADHAEVWAPTQDRQAAQNVIRRVTGLSTDQITLHVPMIGGGFGRRLATDYVEEAAYISHAIQAPVKVFWTRTDDVQHDLYHPGSVTHMTVEIDNPRRLRNRNYAASGLPTGAWRSVGNFTDAFPIESFTDEVALALDRDPVDFRLEIHGSSARGPVIELAAEKAGWGDPLPDGWGRGMAVYSTFNVTHVAHVVEVSVDDQGNVQVQRVVCAVDCGRVVNPDTVKMQMEGGIVFGLSAALYGEITVENGEVQQTNFNDYPVLRFDAMPVVEVYIVESDRNPTGVGEMGVPPIAPALANAIFAATGKRLRRIPFRPADILEA